MNSESNYMEVLIMFKEVKELAKAWWKEPVTLKNGPVSIGCWFMGAGIAFWAMYLIGQLYCLITHKEMRIVSRNK